MAEHYCEEHQVAFEKKSKGDKVWYAHKTEDGWCNEPKEEGEKPKAVSKKPDTMSKDDWADKDAVTRNSIEAQKAADITDKIVRLHKEFPEDTVACC